MWVVTKVVGVKQTEATIEVWWSGLMCFFVDTIETALDRELEQSSMRRIPLLRRGA